MQTCMTCGAEMERSFVHFAWTNRPHEMIEPVECNDCVTGRYLKFAERIYQAWRLSKLDDAAASKLIGIEPGWFNERQQHGSAVYGRLADDPFYDNEECGRAVAKLLAVARNRIAGEVPSNVVQFPSRTLAGGLRS